MRRRTSGGTMRTRACRNCRVECAPAPWWEGRCATCHAYWRHYGVERPRDARRGLGQRPVPCRECGQTTRPRDLALGRCPTCAAARRAPRAAHR
ncbi:MAG TPA: hypothetical protein VII06_12340 [Chloroflexota bacterium]|jgi:hypothetical protein